MTDFNTEQAYKQAKLRLKEERVFYVHVGVYITINIAFIIFFLTSKQYLDNWSFWWLSALRPFLWGIGILCHGLWTFRRNIKWLKNTIYSKRWEEHKITEIMNDDDLKL
ncbi:2TM domain-containing protein [Aquimarina sp. AU474]|uniref:2TM domain-containing protein n=1 Tax=Aquimarina sp. AU474 TaxID=2108529 RepID=UPI000D69E9D2|nr:2TM domain-containing protein [Aquimarina sp. AU474]